ncbi:MAG: tolB protein precursor [Leadbetterella sp.]
MKLTRNFLFIFFIASNTLIAQSQYFGQNKQRNKTNNFKVLTSPHFELYNYLNQSKTATDFLMASEKWYKLHQEVFKLSFIKPNPMILYNSHPDFQETTAIGGEISEGTGGVTEGFRTRVVMPLMYTHRQTDHVLGHELVHAFQYQTMTYGSDSTSLQNIGNVPLFMIEGLAEYMSIGRKDTHTDMWMRDAVLSNDIPTIKDLIVKQHKYFPYRWGQAFWAYVTANYGDDIIRPLFKETAKYGIEQAFIRAFKMDVNGFSARFKKDLIQTFADQKNGRDIEPLGGYIVSEKNGSEMNVSPSISPDGKYIAYISSKNVISMDIYIADANTGKVIRKIESTSFGAHVDSYSFIETSGAWSPDSKRFAIVVQSKAKNKLVVVEIANGNKKEYQPIGMESFTNPAWSPDGSKMVVSGLYQGNSDLYLFNFQDRKTIKLTDDIYSDIQPTWTNDGKTIYFVSDRGGNDKALEKENFKIASIHIETKDLDILPLFKSADNMNPQINSLTQELYFLSDPDGFRNLYSFNINSKKLVKLSNFYTGISGITMYSPAMTISSETDEICYNFFIKGDYYISKAKISDIKKYELSDSLIQKMKYSTPYKIINGADIVQKNLTKSEVYINVTSDQLKSNKYQPRFKLDYLANSGLGMSTSRFGTGVGGGITGLWSDMLNNNQLMGTVALNGEIQDFALQAFYLNQKHPIQFGVSASHIPYRFNGQQSADTLRFLGNQSGLTYYDGYLNEQIIRLFLDDISVFVYKPFSKNTRLELGGSLNWYSFNIVNYKERGQLGFDPQSGFLNEFIPDPNFRVERQNVNSSSIGLNSFRLRQIFAAYVGDNTTFGTVAPLNGYRYRFELARFGGSTSYNSVLADIRKYKFLRPITLAARAMYNGRLNPKNLDLLESINPLYLGYPWNMHGFWGNAITKHGNRITEGNLRGQQMALLNFEARLPFTGPDRLALIDFNYAPSDLNFFIDAGTIWSPVKNTNDVENPGLQLQDAVPFKSPLIVTTGLSLRVNVLGYLILEPYFAIPRYNGKFHSPVTGLNFMVPGW